VLASPAYAWLCQGQGQRRSQQTSKWDAALQAERALNRLAHCPVSGVCRFRSCAAHSSQHILTAVSACPLECYGWRPISLDCAATPAGLHG
jgi:hypothetical protein